jgi:thiamine-phosphate pyrophosphorylase
MPGQLKPDAPQANRPADTTGIYRILDAEANRAAEGLRVIEDYLRFVLADGHLTELAKRLRHDLTAALAPLEGVDRLSARESASDVGAVLAAPPGSARTTVADVAAASFKRVQQALRSLEEYSKLVDPKVAAAIEPLRFRVYTLEKSAGLTAYAVDRLVEGRRSEQEFAALVSLLVAAGVHVLQLRDKQLDDRTLLARAKLLRRLTRGAETLFIMNDRPDLAALSDADGVHVGQEELSVHEARMIVGPRQLIGVSTHNIEQARQAVLDGANYIGVGPTFPSTTKSFDTFMGLDFIRAVSAEISLPAFAIGGITRENLPKVISAGLRRIAVTGAVVNAADPAAAAKELMALLAAK